MKIVCLGQTIGAVAGVGVLASATFAPHAAALGLVSHCVCAFKLRRQLRAVRSA